jgi:hypothetical protein
VITVALERLDPGAVVHDDEQASHVSDVLGHLGVWNGETARALEAHAARGEHTCIEGSGLHDAYNEQIPYVRSVARSLDSTAASSDSG